MFAITLGVNLRMNLLLRSEMNPSVPLNRVGVKASMRPAHISTKHEMRTVVTVG